MVFVLPVNVFAGGIFGSELKQNHACQVSTTDGLISSCKDGDVLIFTPNIFGNEQMPVKIAGLVCDFQHPIVYNEGGVSCIFTSKRKAQW